jgi:putative membrane-bound dehydrogenase-like protein
VRPVQTAGSALHFPARAVFTRSPPNEEIAIALSVLLLPVLASPPLAVPQDFQRLRLSETFYSEGASYGDINGDGVDDVVSGPFWYEGPEFEQTHEFHAAVESDPLEYSDDFFTWVLDLDSDGRNDVLKVGFPGKRLVWYQNPGETTWHWPMHEAFVGVDNESPTLVDLDGDGRPELVCNHQGAFGYAAPNWAAPLDSWTWHPISPDMGKPRFTHGLGVGDINGDGREDVLEAGGWFEQPADLERDPEWAYHPFAFSDRGGGAQMYAYDIDGDGDSDVLTSLKAHGFGLSWFEQVDGGGGDVDFVEHLIMDREREANPWGVRFSALHALAVTDVDGDGLPDLVTGKRHWSHGPAGDPEPVGSSVLYWFRLERTDEGARFVPHLIDDDSGVGTQVVAGDINGDNLCDILVGNKQGTFLHLQNPAGVSIEEPSLFVPSVSEPSINDRTGRRPEGKDGTPLNLNLESGDLTHWTAEGDAFDGQPVRGDTVSARGREPSQHTGDHWIGGYELHGDDRRGTLVSEPFLVLEPWASFLVGGGDRDDVGVQLESEDGEVIFSARGENSESMKVAVADLSPFVGKAVRIRLVDQAEGAWGHINFDDFQFHEAEPDMPSENRVFVRDVVVNAGLSPLEAAEAMSVPDGFHVDLVAAEPDLHQPVALAIDGAGRLWVAEAHSYPIRVPDEEAKDQILVFEDHNGDGHFETRTVFADGLNLVSGLEVGLGGVWVGAAPYLLFIPDRDGDLVPDGEPEVLLDGWEWQDTHETLNAFTWGPDGWLYGCHGVFTHSRVGRPGTPDEERVPIDAGVWRYHPTRREFEVFAWGTSNPWGIDFDDRGQAFITACVIPHLYHVVQGGRYERQAGSHFDAHAFTEIQTIADHRHYLGSVPHEGTNRSSAAGGGHAHCGALIYRGTSFPEEYRGRIFMNNIHGNRINSDSLHREGSGFVGRHEEDLLLANDTWYRGINMKQGPDGAIYFIDWSDERACHSTTPEIWDRTNGRLFRLRYGELASADMDLAEFSDSELIELSMGRDEWAARRARVELGGRSEVAVEDTYLWRLLKSGPTADREIPTAERLGILFAVRACGVADEELLLRLLADSDEHIIAWAVQLACEEGDPSSDVRDRLLELARESESPVVHLYLAAALQRIGPDLDLARALCEYAEAAEDQNIPTVLWYAVEPHVTAYPEQVMQLAFSGLEPMRGWIVRRAASEAGTRDALVRELELTNDRDWRDLLLTELDEALRDERGVEMPEAWEGLYETLASDADESVRDKALWVAAAFGDEAALPRLAELLADDSEEIERRQRALEALAASRSSQVSSALRGVLDDVRLRPAAIRGLAVTDDPETAPALLQLYGDLGREGQDDVLATLSGRESFALALLDAVDQGVVPSADLSAFSLRKLRALESPAVDERLAAVWGIFRESDEEKSARIAELVERFSVQDAALVRPSNGRRVFDQTCGKCHIMFGEGGELGPELTGSNRADLEYLLTNMIDPNAVIGLDYQATIVRTYDDLLVTGVLQGETESSIILATETDEHVVAKEDIDERVLSEVSIMPEGQVDTLTDADLRDLVAFLGVAEQVPRVADEPASDALFNGSDLTGWTGEGDVWSVEGEEIVGKTVAGLPHNSFLISDLELGDFRLSFEVLLVNDEGNSGVQFRSHAEGAEVWGYQADIGPDWWGKLYEEHGRALLWEDSAEQAVRRGEWNEYVIEARGAHLRTWINSEPSVDLEDPEGARSGRIALQVHSGGPTEVRFRNLRLEP